MANTDQWKKRYTVRQFDTTKIPTKEQIAHITECINYMPIQVTHLNGNLPTHFVFMLTPEDRSIKEFLVRNLFHNPEKSEYFTALYDAPYLFLIMEVVKSHDGQTYDGVETTHITAVSAGLITGVILSQALEAGLDVCQIACVEDINALENKKIKSQFYKIIKTRFAKELEILSSIHNTTLISVDKISLGIGVGYGKELSTDYSAKHPELGLEMNPSRKLIKKQPFMFVE